MKPEKVLYPTPNPPYGQKMGIYKAKRLTGFSIRGFTLVEILVSILIFGIIVTTVFGSYRSVISSSQTINRGMNSYSMAERCRHGAALLPYLVTRGPARLGAVPRKCGREAGALLRTDVP